MGDRHFFDVSLEIAACRSDRGVAKRLLAATIEVFDKWPCANRALHVRPQR